MPLGTSAIEMAGSTRGLGGHSKGTLPVKMPLGGVMMPFAELETSRIDRQQETARLAALNSTEILDTAPESSYDAMTRLAAEYFQAELALLGFVDESRIWIKSHWGEAVREFAAQQVVFEMVLAEDGPVVIPDVSKHPRFQEQRPRFRRFDVAFFAAVPVAVYRRTDSGSADHLLAPARMRWGKIPL